MYSLIGKCRKFDMSVDTQLELLDTMLPILTYTSEIWELYLLEN